MSNGNGKATTCLCNQCSGLCCRYFALPIDNPTCAHDFDNIRWYLLHENVTIFVDAGQWYIGIANRCKQLQPDNRCGIYDTRPKICRAYSTENCDYHGGDYDFEMLFTSADQLEQYGRQKLAEARLKKRRSADKSKSTVARRRKARPDLKQLSRKLTNTLLESAPLGMSNGNGKSRGVPLPLLRG